LKIKEINHAIAVGVSQVCRRARPNSALPNEEIVTVDVAIPVEIGVERNNGLNVDAVNAEATAIAHGIGARPGDDVGATSRGELQPHVVNAVGKGDHRGPFDGQSSGVGRAKLGEDDAFEVDIHSELQGQLLRRAAAAINQIGDIVGAVCIDAEPTRRRDKGAGHIARQRHGKSDRACDV
jgi:hypothetical protein